MSFSWKTLLGAGSSGSQNAASASTVTGGERFAGAEDGGVGYEEEHQPLWGLENVSRHRPGQERLDMKERISHACILAPWLIIHPIFAVSFSSL